MIASIAINQPGVRAVLSAASPSATVRFVGTQGPAGASNLTPHINAATPHPAYDDMPDMTLIFDNGLV
jgi:hypothetical protein